MSLYDFELSRMLIILFSKKLIKLPEYKNPKKWDVLITLSIVNTIKLLFIHKRSSSKR